MGRTDFEAREPVAAARELLDTASGDPVYALDQPVRTTTAVVRAAYEGGGPPLRIVAPREELVTLRNRFPTAARAAALAADDRLAVRAHEGAGLTPMFVTDEEVRVMLTVEDAAAVGGHDEGSFVEDAPNVAERAWENAESFDLRAPPLDRVTDAMTEAFGEAFRDDFETALAAARWPVGSLPDTSDSSPPSPAAPGPWSPDPDAAGVEEATSPTTDESESSRIEGELGGESELGGEDGSGNRREPPTFDEVGVTLVLAAKHEELYYEVSRWGEDTGIASEATFSRRKRRLEEADVLDTEKQPIDMGRPRQRLVLGSAAADRLTLDGIPGLVGLVADSTE
ncbi:MAG: DUF5821 family protein [Halobaculum sp.]